MKVKVSFGNSDFEVDLTQGLDISIPLSAKGPRAWYVGEMRIAPVINQHVTGSVKLGGAVNFNDICFNPHGHGTHTESVGHISKELVSVHDVFQKYFFHAQLITLEPEVVNEDNGWIKKGDRIITLQRLQQALGENSPEALVIRTVPNTHDKLRRNYSSTNFPYFTAEALAYVADKNIEHLLVDLPSVDREEDGGLLLAHHAFWKFPEKGRVHCTITEFIFVDENIKDGMYLLNMQLAPFVNDAAPSRPVLYTLKETTK